MFGVILKKKFLFIVYYQGLLWSQGAPERYLKFYDLSRPKLLNHLLFYTGYKVSIFAKEDDFYQACREK